MWYSVSLLFEGVHQVSEAEDVNLWEESIVLIEAEDRDEAEGTARKLAVQREHSYETSNGDQLRWTFREVAAVYEVFDNNLGHGIEVFSRFLRPGEAASLTTPFDDNEFRKGPDGTA